MPRRGQYPYRCYGRSASSSRNGYDRLFLLTRYYSLISKNSFHTLIEFDLLQSITDLAFCALLSDLESSLRLCDLDIEENRIEFSDTELRSLLCSEGLRSMKAPSEECAGWWNHDFDLIHVVVCRFQQEGPSGGTRTPSKEQHSQVKDRVHMQIEKIGN